MTAPTNQPRFVDQLRQNEQTIMELKRRIKELEDGLRPFAKMAPAYVALTDRSTVDWLDIDGQSYDITVGDFRRATSLLPGEKRPAGKGRKR